jgi:hypothetical protein
MSDPFNDWGADQNSNLDLAVDVGTEIQGQPRMLLPVSLAMVTFIGALTPWIVLRPLGKDSSTYNLTDIPGGIGVLMTIFVFALVSCVVMVWKRMTGMVMLSLSVVTLGWMASISGILLGTLSSLIPAIEVAGIDLRRAQLGQGSGVVISALASLTLAFLCIRQLEPVSRFSPSHEVPIVQIAAVVPVVIVTTSLHQGWVLLGNPDAQWNAMVPGNSLYGSGLLNLALWVSVGVWLTSIVLRRPVVIRSAGVLGILVGLVTLGYTALTWLGGKALSWLLPSSIEGWAGVTMQPSLYLTTLCAIAMVGLGILSLFMAEREKSVRLASNTKVATLTIPTSDLAAYLLWMFVLLFYVYTQLR